MDDVHSTIDWPALLAELDPQDSDHQQRQLTARLRQRAQQYAASKQMAASEPEGHTVLVFRLAQERYALPAMVVRGVRPLHHLTRVPSVPPFYRGVVNVRGQILSVVDLRPFFGMTLAEDEAPPQELIIVAARGLELGVLAHHVEDVAHLPPSALGAVEIRYAQGVTADRLVLLDMDQVFADERLIIAGGDHD